MISYPRDCFLVSIAAIVAGFFSHAGAEKWSQLTFATASSCDDFLEELRSLVQKGNLSLARRKALKAIHNPALDGCSKSDISKSYIASFQENFDAIGNDYFGKIHESLRTKKSLALSAKNDGPNCVNDHLDWNVVDPNTLWDQSCSILPLQKAEKSFPHLSSGKNFRFESSAQTTCCEFAPGSWTYLRLPAIQEPAIRLRIPQLGNKDSQKQQNKTSASLYTSLNLEQDGYLRPFDVSGILWPTGYLLSICLGDVLGCPIPELRALFTQYQQNFASKNALYTNMTYRNHFPLALELGAGIGAPSIALSKSLERIGFPFSSPRHQKGQPWVVASDFAPHALALTMANAKNNHADIGIALVDHFNQSCLQHLRTKFFKPESSEIEPSSEKQMHSTGGNIGFPLVYGSSLQGLFQETDRADSALWRTLHELIDFNNPNALAILVHNRANPLMIPNDINFSFELVRKLSGGEDFFGNMKARASGTSEFEIYVFRPKPTGTKSGEARTLSRAADIPHVEL